MRTILGWLLAALLLGAAALLIVNYRQTTGGSGGGAVPVGARVIPIQPPLVREIEIDRAGEPTRTLRRDDQGNWTLKTGDGHAWDIDPRRTRAVLQVMNETIATAEPASDETLGERPTSLRLTLDDASGSVDVRLAERTLGGYGYVEVDAPDEDGQLVMRRARIDAGLHNAFAGDGVLAWRQTLPMGAPMAGGVSRISVELGDSRVALARRDAKWVLTAPIASRADEGPIRELLTAISGLRITDFRDRAPPSEFGVEASVLLERDERVAADDGVRSRTRRWRVDLGARTIGDDVLARFAENAPVVALDPASVEGLVALVKPENFVARTASGRDPSNIGGIVLGATDSPEPRRLLRRAETWYEVSGTLESQLDPAQAAGAQASVAFFTSERAPAILLTEPTGFLPVLIAELLSIDGSSVESFTLGTAGGSLIVHDGIVYRAYDLRTVPPMIGALVEGAIAPPQVGPDGAPVPIRPGEVSK